MSTTSSEVGVTLTRPNDEGNSELGRRNIERVLIGIE